MHFSRSRGFGGPTTRGGRFFNRVSSRMTRPIRPRHDRPPPTDPRRRRREDRSPHFSGSCRGTLAAAERPNRGVSLTVQGVQLESHSLLVHSLHLPLLSSVFRMGGRCSSVSRSRPPREPDRRRGRNKPSRLLRGLPPPAAQKKTDFDECLRVARPQRTSRPHSSTRDPDRASRTGRNEPTAAGPFVRDPR